MYRPLMILVAAMLILGAVVPVMSADTAYIVISEIQVAGNEFVELYNPTNIEVSMEDLHWCYFSSGRDWNNSHRDQEFPNGATIPAYGFYLIGLKGYPESGGSQNSDWQPYSSAQLGDSAGSVGIFPWDPDKKTAEEAKNGRIDVVAWGCVTYVKESFEAATPTSGESLERKAIASSKSITMTSGGDHHTWGNGEDTNNNSADFITKTTPEPQNSTSNHEKPPSRIGSCNASGREKNIFDLSENVYCYARNLSLNDPAVDIYVAPNKAWAVGDPIGSDVSDDGVNTVSTDGYGNIDVIEIWPAPLTVGQYDIIVDLNQNGFLDAGEPVDDKVNVGFEAIPEFTTIAIPIAIVLGLMFLFHRRKQKS